jgi:hypothetical protein
VGANISKEGTVQPIDMILRVGVFARREKLIAAEK